MKSFRIGRVFGIPIELDGTFLLVLPLFAWLIGRDVAGLVEVLNGVFGFTLQAGPLTAGYTNWLLGLAAAVGLFACVLLHELGHSVVAMRYGYDIDSITLWLFGGIARFTEIPEDWKVELQVAVAGPVVSVLLGVVAYGLTFALGASEAALFLAAYLALMNVTLAAFNMLPGFPMDGGRVLRALLARSRPYAEATQIAAEVGKGFAFLLGLVGLLSNLYLVALAFFIYIGAAGEAQQTVMRAAFRGVTVGDVMTGEADLKTVSPEDSVADLLDRMLRERHTGYPVVDAGADLVGMVTLEDAQRVKEVERDAVLVEEVMSKDVNSVTPESDALEAFQRMQEGGVGRLPVVDANGDLVGLVSRTDLMTAFDILQSGGSAESLAATGQGLPGR